MEKFGIGEHLDIKHLSDRDYFCLISNHKHINSYPLKGHEKILELSLIDVSLAELIIPKRFKCVSIDTIDLFTNDAELIDLETHPSKENQYDVIFCLLHLSDIHVELSDLLQYIYHVLRPGGRLFFTYLSNRLSTKITYKQVVESGRFPTLKKDSLIKHTFHQDVLNHIKNIPFSICEIREESDSFPLPDLATFRRILQDVSYLYKKVIPSDLSEEVIDMQTAFFDEYCKSHYDGKYFFECVMHIIEASK